jgi:hypothetical protein
MMPSAPVSRPASFWHSLSTPLKLQNWLNKPEKQVTFCFSGLLAIIPKALGDCSKTSIKIAFRNFDVG